jgi:hydroxymethylpyrimidine pyrophosphatase-like HAD family hydrolase
MRYLALASDYDGTLARHGSVSESTVEALVRFRKSGRVLLLVTGRELAELESVFPRLEIFHRIVAENGALLYNPETREKRPLAEPPPASFIDKLRERGVAPLSVGEVIVATSHPHETTVLATIRDHGLELNVIFNKGAVMILPAGVNKLTGLRAALDELGLSEHNVAGVGDAENDHAFLRHCEFGAAVQNALQSVKDTADLVTAAGHGQGVIELINHILEDDLASYNAQLVRHDILIGHEGGDKLFFPSYGSNMLIAGASGSGKSTFTMGLLETIQNNGYQFCLIDPEGDYQAIPGAVTIGDESHPASEEQTFEALRKPSSHAVVNLVGIPIQDRPSFFGHLLPRLQEMRKRTGRPHWIVVDEAHHMFPSHPGPTTAELPPDMRNIVMVTVHPGHVLRPVLQTANVVVAIGGAPGTVLEEFAHVAGVPRPAPAGEFGDLPSGRALYWFRDTNQLRSAETVPAKAEHSRHKRKYAHGELEPDRSFYFTGPRGQFKLRAQNLTMFLQLAEGLDDETWQYHLACGDYSAWFREAVRDNDLANEAGQIEKNRALDAKASREQIKRAIEERYTAPA